MAALAIPDPSLVVLIGAAGAGKTTFASRHFDPSEILSSDAYRALISGDEADQTVTRAAFGRLHRELARRLTLGKLSVIDATNVDPGARRALLQRSRAAGVPAIAIVFDLEPDVVLTRNLARTSRVVDPRIVLGHLARLRASLDAPGPNLGNEGFQEVVRLRDPIEIDEVRIVRVW